MPRADQATIDLLTDYFQAMEVKDFDRLGAYYADDITQTFANAPTITGRDTMLSQHGGLLGKVKSLAHPLINVWQEDDGVVIFEVTSVWRFHDDTEVKINACSIFTIVDGKFTDQRIYVDNAPIDPTSSRQHAPDYQKASIMSRILITGSAQGLGRNAATALLDDGHQVVVHARSHHRAADLSDLADRGAAVVVGNLADLEQTRSVADQVNQLGRMDAVIHNAGVYGDTGRHPSLEDHPRVLTVNTLAPYLLTGLIQRPDRLIYLTSDMHASGDDSLHDLTWSSRRWNGTQAYCDSKLFVTALALAVARRWPDVISHAVDPGWVPTRMGGPAASDDLEQGHLTQTWLATTDDPEALRSGQVWKHRRPTAVAAAAQDATFQDRLLDQLAGLTSYQLVEAPAQRS